jgi:hypothetical protein
MTTIKPLSADELKRASDLMKVLSHPTRLRLAFLLAERESSVTEMERTLEIRQPSRFDWTIRRDVAPSQRTDCRHKRHCWEPA